MSHSASHNSSPTTGASGYERREVNVKLILFSTAVMVTIVLTVCFFTVALFDFLNKHSGPVDQTTTLQRPKETPPEPRGLEHPWEQLPVLRSTEDRVLNSYAWLDQKTDQVRIPVDRALDLIAERGLPVAPRAGAQATVKKTMARSAAPLKENGGK